VGKNASIKSFQGNQVLVRKMDGALATIGVSP